MTAPSPTIYGDPPPSRKLPVVAIVILLALVVAVVVLKPWRYLSPPELAVVDLVQEGDVVYVEYRNVGTGYVRPGRTGGISISLRRDKLSVGRTSTEMPAPGQTARYPMDLAPFGSPGQRVNLTATIYVDRQLFEDKDGNNSLTKAFVVPGKAR